MSALPPLNGLKAFEAAGRHLNFRQAAEELNVTQGAVSQQVRSLEAYLDVQLFHRRPRGLALTDEGRRYLAPIRRAFEIMAEATTALRPRDAVITISTTPTFATKWLVPRLGAFSADHPDIRVRLDASNTLVNFQSDGVDVAVRQGRPPFGPGLVATPLFSSDLIAVCHPDMTKGAQPLRLPQDLCRYTLLQDTHGGWALFLERAFGDEQVPEMRIMNFSQTSLAIDAAIAGQGVALTNRAFVEADLASGRLCQPFTSGVSTEQGYFIVAPRSPRHPELVRIMRDWLTAQI